MICEVFEINHKNIEHNMSRDLNIAHITPELWNNNSKICKEFIDSELNWQLIPLFNYIAPENVKDMQFVRFHGMIQNMHNPEFFLSKYEVRNCVTGKSSIVSGKFKDSVVCQENEKFVEDSEHIENGERETWLCVPVPALNDWVTSSWKKLHLKRHYSDGSPGPAKRLMTESQETSEDIVNAPDSSTVCLPEPCRRKCYLKLYDFDTTPYSLNDVVEVAGFLSLLHDADIEDGFTMSSDSSESRIPYLHVVACKKIISNLPLLQEVSSDTLELGRKDLNLLLSQLLLGDTLAADYFLTHLLSSVYSRTDLMPLGQLPLNIINIPKAEYAKELYGILKLLVEKSVYFPMSLENLNRKSLTPKKNYENDELCHGLLQLSPHTHLVLDETQMEAGKLENLGVLNMTALRKLVVEQKVAYDFQYYHLDFNSDIPVLVFSEGKSLLPCSTIVPLEPDADYLETIPEICQAALHFLQPSVLDRIRAYLLLVRSLTFTIEQDMEQIIQEDFLKLRQNKDLKTSVEDLHNLMVLCRLMSISVGEETLSAKTWEHTLSLETRRKQRLSRANIGS